MPRIVCLIKKKKNDYGMHGEDCKCHIIFTYNILL